MGVEEPLAVEMQQSGVFVRRGRLRTGAVGASPFGFSALGTGPIGAGLRVGVIGAQRRRCSTSRTAPRAALVVRAA